MKGGEELRIDQRVEQLLGVMNGLLACHAPSAAHSLEVGCRRPVWKSNAHKTSAAQHPSS